MYTEHGAFKLPIENKKIWRYIDLSKFLNLVNTKKIFFCPISQLSDQFEGRVPEVTKQYWLKRIEDGYNGGSGINFTPKHLETHLQLFELLRKCTMVNCWHMNDYESAAMWKMYSKNEYGLAIVSSIEKLKRSIITEDEVFIGKVDYYTPEKPPLDLSNGFFPTLNKLVSYSHENEIRAVIKKEKINSRVEPEFPNGKFVDVELGNLIEQVFISPNAPKELRDLVSMYLEKNSINVEVHQSTLKDTYLR